MNKKIILSILSVALVGTSGALIYNLKSDDTSETSSVNLNLESEASKPEENKDIVLETLEEKPEENKDESSDENEENNKEENSENNKKEEPKEETLKENNEKQTTETSKKENDEVKKIENTKKENTKKENSTNSDKSNSSVKEETKDSQKNESKVENNKTETVTPTKPKEPSKPETSTSFTNGLTRENLNGYYQITRNDGGVGYAKMTNDGLFTIDQKPSGVVSTSVYKVTPKSSADKNKFEIQLNGEMKYSSFTVKDDDELYAHLPNFGDAKNYVYKRISQSEYENGAQKLIVRENKFSVIADYYFSNRGQVGTMSSIESTIKINNKDYKILKSLKSDQKVIISLFGQTYNYNTYKTTGSLVIDNSDIYCGFN